MNNRFYVAILLLCFAFAAISCQKKLKGEDVTPLGAPSPVELRFTHVVNRFRDLLFDSTYVGPEFDNTTFNFKVSTFKYYISNIEFIHTISGDTIKIPETYFLIDHSKPETMKALMTIPAGEYYGMSFLIGVDSARNVRGPQTGALDPALGMFWNRTDGYIMAKLEGTASTSNLPGKTFSLHVGGFKAPNSVLFRRHVKLGGNISATPNRKTVIHFTADVFEWFRPNRAFSAGFTLDAPGQHAVSIGLNYQKMFEFKSVSYE